MCSKKFVFARCGCVLILFLFQATVIKSQDYDVSDIQCTFSNSGEGGSSARDSVMARLRKPEGFRGAPLFADDRSVDPLKDVSCQIRPDTSDTAELTYDLLVTDFSRCGVLKRNGFVHVRVWFPQFNGVVMMSDQELIIMCKPPESTIIQNKAAGFAGSFPQGARVSGVVEETPGRLEYEVALYKEATPSRTAINHSKSELPVDQAVPIGTKLQLRARINPESAWKYVKLMEVTVSPDPDEPHSSGSVALVKDGCRNRDFATIIPHQPARYRDKPNEVFLDFEAFLLSTMKERSTLWIHSQIKACMDPTDCQPEYCLDLFEPAGHGRRRRTLYSSETLNVTHRVGRNKKLPNAEAISVLTNDTTQYAKFKENIEYTVIMPGDLYHNGNNPDAACSTFLMLAVVLGSLLFVSAFFMCYLASRLHVAVTLRHHAKSIDQLVREQTRNYGADRDKVEYTGRNTVQ